MLVLVADDDRAVREALERALQLHGYEVTLASDGDAALTAVDSRTPDALVLDVMMPGLDGLDVTRRLRRQGNRVPILLLTARDAVGDRVEGLDAGAARRRSPLRRPHVRSRIDGRAPRRPPLRADDDRGAPARAVPPEPAA